MSDPPEGIVQYAYDNITEWYLQWVKDNKSPRERYTKSLLEKLEASPSPSILDLGCGPGVPVLELLLKHGAQVVANDISAKQCKVAKANFPDATVLPGDMMALSFEAGIFDGIVSFYTLFHLPRAKLKAMLAKIHGWLKPGGVFALNLATFDEEEIHGEFFGYGMFWSSYDLDGNQELLREVGFDLLQVEVFEAGEGALEENDPDFGAEFMWVMARKN
ncbi:methyltransferase domain-containing protein [Colletotrichum graminicola M1.001]|uniref:Methyltransferase domain-containing protein n=1 Tax=Colletotrichum graminicola (strain M1.001 / M2 / FGSC 10212) TaxID=645133 RepID=E3QX11_COLGM|nr:methyltransferase domain-containing protein [Colletotrichum graminicola M1.001]EFQ35399.1 methyltransferase domain-containing protein [Colletotrichum graminicola M1.001]